MSPLCNDNWLPCGGVGSLLPAGLEGLFLKDLKLSEFLFCRLVLLLHEHGLGLQPLEPIMIV